MLPVIIKDVLLVGEGEKKVTQLVLTQKCPIKRQSDGSIYIGHRDCRILVGDPSEKAEWDELKGQEFPYKSRIKREECDEYEWTNEKTGEVMKLSHTYTLDILEPIQ